MIAASVGVGTGTSGHGAGREAALAAIEGLPSKKPKVLLVFGSVFFDQDALMKAVAETAPGATIVGCSTAGEISMEGFMTEKSVVIMAIESDTIDFFGAVGNHLAWNSHEAGVSCANAIQYNSRGYARSCLMFLDVISGNGEPAVAGVREKLGGKVALYGAAAGDDQLFFETYQYLNGVAYSGSVVGLGLAGNFTIAAEVADGFLPIGMPRKVTKAKGVSVAEIDHAPAVRMYEEYFGPEHASDLNEQLLSELAVTFPLGMFDPERNALVTRNPVYADKNGGMIFTAHVPQDAEVNLMISDTEEVLRSARAAAERAMKKLNGKIPRAVLVFDSIARKKLLGVDVDEEIHTIQNIVGRDVPLAGFYGYAQIDTVATGRTPFYNTAIIIWILAD